MQAQKDMVKEMHKGFENKLLEQFQNNELNEADLVESIQYSQLDIDKVTAEFVEDLNDFFALLSEEQRKELVDFVEKKHKK